MKHKILAVACTKNSKGKVDGDYFRSERDAFCNWADGESVTIAKLDLDRKPWQNRKQLLKVLRDFRPTCFAYFGHGTAKSLPQIAVNVWNMVECGFTSSIPRRAEIRLYSCLTGKSSYKNPLKWKLNHGDRKVHPLNVRPVDGFAINLARHHHGNIWAHTTKGDATRNPSLVKIWMGAIQEGSVAHINRKRLLSIDNNRFALLGTFG